MNGGIVKLVSRVRIIGLIVLGVAGLLALWMSSAGGSSRATAEAVLEQQQADAVDLAELPARAKSMMGQMGIEAEQAIPLTPSLDLGHWMVEGPGAPGELCVVGIFDGEHVFGDSYGGCTMADRFEQEGFHYQGGSRDEFVVVAVAPARIEEPPVLSGASSMVTDHRMDHEEQTVVVVGEFVADASRESLGELVIKHGDGVQRIVIDNPRHLLEQ